MRSQCSILELMLCVTIEDDFVLQPHGFVSRSTGEESVEQIGSRAERMGLMGNAGIYLYSATRLEVRAGAPACSPRLASRAVSPFSHSG